MTFLPRRSPLLPFAAAALLAATSLAAQDLLGVTWNGAVVRVNSYTGGVTPLGPGLFGQNCVARATDGTFWSARRNSSTSFSFTNIDPNTGVATVVASGIDVRGLTTGPTNSLYGLQYNAVAGVLVRILTPSGFVIPVGSTGFNGIQSLAMHQGVLYGWDVFAGLVVIDTTTGAATDPFPGVSGPIFLQSLCSHPDGRLLVGGGDSGGPDALYSVDVPTGTVALIGPMTGAVDVRGLEPLAGFTVPAGQGCNGAFGQVVLAATGSPQPGGTLLTTSNNHAPNAIGLVLFGSSAASWQGLPLPLLLDPLFGTSNCNLYVSVDGSFATVANASTPAQLQFGFTVPAGASGASLHLQHACLEAVPGGLSVSNRVTVQIQ
jgi:hypothetical protein